MSNARPAKKTNTKRQRYTKTTKVRKSSDSSKPTSKRFRRLRESRVGVFASGKVSSLKVRRKNYLSRRPHRSFRRTYRRDYVRSLQMPGYIAFTRYANRMLMQRASTYVLLAVIYAAIMLAVGAVTSQDTYTQISDLLKDSSKDFSETGLNKLGQAGLLLVSAFAGGPQGLAAEQVAFLSFTLLMVWLASVWLMREYLMGRKPRLRDGLYNAGSPILSTYAVAIILLFQLFPIAIVALLYSGLASYDLVSQGFGSMLFWMFAVIVATLCLYWATSTIVALVVVTLPGMYPMAAIRAAGDLVMGRRLRVLYRLLWGILMIAITWILITVPMVFLDAWLKSTWPALEQVPLMPSLVAFMTSLTCVWYGSYVYLLYRRIVDDNAKPA